MEELAAYLTGEDVVMSYQECWEHERMAPSNADVSAIRNSRSIWRGVESLGIAYSSQYLTPSDPSHYIDKDHGCVAHPNDCVVDMGFIIIRKWEVFSDKNHTGDAGWLYADSFESFNWDMYPSEDMLVRKRKWEQLSVDISQEDLLPGLIQNFHNRFRSVNPWLIERALRRYDRKIQVVLQCQRLFRDSYNGHHLTPADPMEWSQCGDSSCADICMSRLSRLEAISRSQYAIPEMWQPLHDFMFVIYPSKDETGWQYGSSFDSFDWSPVPNEESSVRRRVWMRTLVKENELEACRNAFYAYIQSHPRGVIMSTPLQRQSHFRKRWCNGVATLSDSKIDLILENNYKQNVAYDIKGCEVKPLNGTTGHYTSDADKYFLFGLRRIGGAVILGKIENPTAEGIVCVLNALSAQDRDKWIDALNHQLMLINGHFYSHSEVSGFYGPPTLVDTPYFSWRLMKKGKVVWKTRTFELRKSGVFAYYKRGTLIGEVSIAGCSVHIPHDVNHHHPFAIMDSEGEIMMVLSATTEEVRDQWMAALRGHITATNEGKAAFWYNGDSGIWGAHSFASSDDSGEVSSAGYMSPSGEMSPNGEVSSSRFRLLLGAEQTGSGWQLEEDEDDAAADDDDDCSSGSSFQTLTSSDLEGYQQWYPQPSSIQQQQRK
jgi:hypothetical protein